MSEGRWKVDRLDEVEARMPAACDWLSDSEAARLAGLRLEARRRQYLAGHWLAREVLATLGGWAVPAGALIERKGSAPAVVAPVSGLRVSISHTEGWLAAAAAMGPVGIDIEQAGRAHRLADVADKLAAVGESPAELDAAALLRRWVAKEAWIKCSLGAALPERLAEIGLSGRGTPPPQVGVFGWGELVVGLAAPEGIRGLQPRVARDDRLESWQVADRRGASVADW